MMPYFVSYAILAATSLLGLWTGRVRLAALVAFSAMFYLIARRGLVGVDSAFYVQQFDTIRYSGLFAAGFEPGFALLIYILTFFFADSFQILILLGCTAAIVLLIGALWLEREPVLFLTIVLPFFLFDMTMNGLRYGLAFAIITLGTAAWCNGRRWLFFVSLALAASIQISSIILAVGTWILVEARFRTFVGTLIVGITIVYFFGDYLGEKAAQNADLVALGGFSGVVPFLITTVILASAALNPSIWRELRLPIIGLATLQIAAFWTARYYYAGLRLQSIVIFMSYLVLAFSISRHGLKLRDSRIAVVGLMAALLLSTALRLKNFSDEEGFGISPFAPYFYATELAA